MRPDAVWADPTLRAVVTSLVSVDSIDEMAVRTGIDPRQVTEAVLAEYTGGTLLLLRGPFVASEIVLQAEVRMSLVESRSDAPFVRRGGLFGPDRRDVVALDEHVLLVASDVEALSAVLACAGRAPGSAAACRPAVASVAARALAVEARDAPVALIAPAHLDLPPGLGASLLLAEERALAATATPDGDAIAFRLHLEGDFPPGADGNFRSLVESLARTELGGVLALSEALPTLLVGRTEDGVRVSTRLPRATVVRAVKTLFGGEIREILGPSAENQINR